MVDTDSKRIPTRFLIRHDSSQQDLLCCPECGFDYVHIGCVNIEQGHQKIHAIEDFAITNGSSRHETKRGSEVQVTFWCENGHEFEYRFSFCKGQTSVELYKTDIYAEVNHLELWRN